MRFLFLAIAAVTMVGPAMGEASPSDDMPVDHDVGPPTLGPNTSRLGTIKSAFRFAWGGYRRFAFPNDDLRPVSNTAFNSRNHWGASAVDALSTAIVMDMADVVNDILGFIPTIDFANPEGDVNLFESTIRYMGGLISAFDLLSGPKSNLVSDPNKLSGLLNQAVRLANRLKFAFNTPTGIPFNTLDFRNRGAAGQETNLLATVGTLVLEWTRLSDLTGNQEYGQLAQRAQAFLINPSPVTAEPFPGLVGSSIDVQTGQFRDSFGGWGGGSDSFYEYLLKSFIYDPRRFGFYKTRWVAAAESSIRFLSSRPAVRPDLLFLARYNGRELIAQGEHLTCFAGGNFVLGGAMLDRNDFIDFGRRLIDTCHHLYNSTASGLGPETYGWSTPAPSAQAAFYAKKGFFVRDSKFLLRPEVIESYYYAYRVTGDARYREWAWDAFVAIDRASRASSGFTAISDVTNPNGGAKFDFQESFVFSELLKYLYLIFNDAAPVQAVPSLAKTQWVFSTEGHPIKTIR